MKTINLFWSVSFLLFDLSFCLESVTLHMGNLKLCKTGQTFGSNPSSHFSQLFSPLQPNLRAYSKLREPKYLTEFVPLWRDLPTKIFSCPGVAVFQLVQNELESKCMDTFIMQLSIYSGYSIMCQVLEKIHKHLGICSVNNLWAQILYIHLCFCLFT